MNDLNEISTTNNWDYKYYKCFDSLFEFPRDVCGKISLHYLRRRLPTKGRDLKKAFGCTLASLSGHFLRNVSKQNPLRLGEIPYQTLGDKRD